MSVLDEIILGVREDLAERAANISLAKIKDDARLASPTLDVMEYFSQSKFGVIAEVKRSSPSKGVLADIADPAELAREYEIGGACAISVLTEQRRFKGSLADLAAVRSAVKVPILRKEFIVDEYQIYEARAYGADIILLIVAALTDQQILQFAQIADQLNMRTLIEVHDESEISRTLHLRAESSLRIDLLGINARNLKTLEIDSTSFARLAPLVPREISLIAESGIGNSQQVGELAGAGASGVLVGEALVKDGQPAEAIKDFLNRANRGAFRRLGR